MKIRLLTLALLAPVVGLNAQTEPAGTASKTLTPVTFEQVQLTDRFLAPWQERQKEVTIPVAFKNVEPAVENLRRTANFLAGVPDTLPIQTCFLSSDLYKVMESAAYSLRVVPDKALEAYMDSIVAVIAAAQKPDGYLYENHTCGNPMLSQQGPRPYSKLGASHELYDLGHMYEAAVAYYQATGKDNLLKVAEKSAHHVNKVFFEGDPAYNDGKPVNQPPGHQEIELALCRMFEVTHDSLYLQMARRFLDIRGIQVAVDEDYGSIHGQQHQPVREQREPAGHAVRAAYMYAGMADVDALYGTDEYGEALRAIWENIVTSRMAITGGLGAVRNVEGFGPEFDLPNKESYNETCASVANVFFNDRMFRASREGRYYDVLECALYNGALAGISLSGDRFFYVNPLEVDGVAPFNAGARERSLWFGCACCPPNISRLLMRISGYLYSHTDRDIYCTLYASSNTDIALSEGRVKVEQSSNYPFAGTSFLELTPEKPMQFALRLRIPTWALDREFIPGGLYTYTEPLFASWSVKVNGATVQAKIEQGFAVIDRLWKPGDKVELSLPMQARYVQAREEVKSDRGRLAVVCGPLVYCAEGVDNGLVQRYWLPEQADLKREMITEGPLQGIVSITTTASRLDTAATKLPLRLVPYFAWNNRGQTTMNVFLPTTEALARETLPVTMRNEAWLKDMSLTCQDTPEVRAGLLDDMTPARSHHMGMPSWQTQECPGEPQQAEFLFKGPQPLEAVSIFWVNDKRRNAMLPKSWTMEYLSDGKWQPMRIYLTDSYGLMIDQFNTVHPAGTLSCEGVRILVIPQAGCGIGISEVRFDFAK